MTRSLVPPSRVLVRLPSWLGDCVMCEPVVRALFQRYCNQGCADRVTLVAPRRLLSMFDERFVGVRRVACERGEPEDLDAWRGHDVALLLNGSWNSAWTAFRAGIPARIGFARGGRAALLSTGIVPALERGKPAIGTGVGGRWPRAMPRPFGAVCVEIAAHAGLEVRDRKPHLVAQSASLTLGRERLLARGVDVDRGFVLAHAGARVDSAKAFPAAQWRLVFEALARESDLALVVACAPGEEANARAAMCAVRDAGRAGSSRGILLLDDPAPDLDLVIALTALSRLVVTADSGPRHLAHALDVPCVVACGPTDPRHTAEHDASTRIVRVDVDCGPCHRETCPLSDTSRHACMTRIDPDLIVRCAVDLLTARSAKARRAAETSSADC